MGDEQGDPGLARSTRGSPPPSTACRSCSSGPARTPPASGSPAIDNAFDSTQEFFAILAGFDASSIDQLMDQNEAMIEAAGVNQASYMAPGSRATRSCTETFVYTQEVEGVAFLDWLTAFLGRHRRRRRRLRGLLVAGTPVRSQLPETWPSPVEGASLLRK